MTTTESSIAHLLLKSEIEAFLFEEAEILDDRNFADWLDLLTDDIRYWMPMRRNVKSNEMNREFTREGQDINWFDEVSVRCRFLVYRNRVETETDFLIGKREDTLRKVNGDWKIAGRKITLDQSVLLAKNLTFFF